MSLPEQKIDSFLELLTQQRNLFSAEQLTELSQLIESLPDELDVLSEAITTWCANNPAIEEARSKLLEPLPPNSKASETPAASSENSESQTGDRLNKQALQNALLL
jgi:DNA-binding SARP family transcriptional activator